MQIDSSYQDNWLSDMKNELLCLVDLYQTYCSCDGLLICKNEMPNWSIVQDAIVSSDSPEALIDISEKLVEINNQILGQS